MAKRKEYSKEFKEEAIRLAQESGNVSETARNLGLHLSILRRWKNEVEQERPPRGERKHFQARGMLKMKNSGSYKERINV